MLHTSFRLSRWFCFEHPQLLVREGDANKSGDPNNQAQMIPYAEFLRVLYENQEGGGEENNPEGLNLKEKEEAKVRILSKVFSK